VKPYYQDAHATIWHGDCLDVLPRIGGKVQTTVTSPPYNQLGIRIPEKPSGMHSSNGWIKNVRAIGYGDDMTEEMYTEWQCDVAAVVLGFTKPNGSFFYNHKIRYRDTVLVHPIDMVRRFNGWKIRQEIIWDRGGSMVLNARMFAPSEERVYWLIRGKEWVWNQDAMKMSVWAFNPVVGFDGHPCPYPYQIPERCILATTNPGDTVLDPFMGSGTTLESAKKLGRKSIGVEIEERYCEIAAQRLSQEVLAL